MDKQLEDNIIGELQQASVPFFDDMNLEQFEHCRSRVPTQPRVQQFSYEQKLSIEHDFPTMRLSIYSGG